MVRGWNEPGCRISVRFADSAEQRELRVSFSPFHAQYIVDVALDSELKRQRRENHLLTGSLSRKQRCSISVDRTSTRSLHQRFKLVIIPPFMPTAMTSKSDLALGLAMNPRTPRSPRMSLAMAPGLGIMLRALQHMPTPSSCRTISTDRPGLIQTWQRFLLRCKQVSC